MNPVIHFELPADDQKRQADFYARAFGWEIKDLGSDYDNYIMVMTTESDTNGPKKLGIINGGLYKKRPDMGEVHPSVVIAVDDIEAHLKKIEEAGGTRVGEPIDIPGVGLYAAFKDTEGNQLSIIKPSMPMAATE